MSQAKHTTGPWCVEGSESSLDYQMEYWIQANGKDLCAVNSETDARLIAAAPELLEALSDTLALLEAYCGESEECTRNQARAAIAKATGSQ